MVTLYLEASHGTLLTAGEQNNAEDAAMAVFDNCTDIAIAAEHAFNLSCFNEDHDKTLADLWYDAEYAAITAATKGWHNTPEDLTLKIA